MGPPIADYATDGSCCGGSHGWITNDGEEGNILNIKQA